MHEIFFLLPNLESLIMRLQHLLSFIKQIIDLHNLIWERILADTGMRVHGDRRAAPCHVDTDGVLPHGLWAVQAIPAEHQSSKPSEPILHLPRTSLAREHGVEAKAHQDEDFSSSLKGLQSC